MNGAKPAGRSRPTNNQLLYKAHFRWKHYTQELPEDMDKPAGTEACASVTSAFLQVLATIHQVEAGRIHKPRNVLQILSTNTRRTKVVELSSGTHRVADELRRHCLADGAGGHYSTNLDRNRYGADNNYLFTVTRYNLECLGLCPCMVDIEIIDTRNGNESQLVTAGDAACSCDSPERQELANTSNFAVSNPRVAPPSPPREMMRRVASTTNVNGMRRVNSAAALRRNPSSNRLYDVHPTHSRNSGGSDLFDALLMAATGEHDGRSQGEAPVSSRQAAPKNRLPPTSTPRLWAQGSAGDMNDSLHNAMEALQRADPESLARLGSKGVPAMPRRNSVSMIVENPVLAQTGGGDSLLMGHYFPMMMGGVETGGERDHSMHSGEGEGDTGEHGEDGAAGGVGGGGESEGQAAAFRGLMRQFNKQSSAVNLTRLAAGPVEVRRLQEEVRHLREECKAAEAAAEEARSAQKAAERTADEAAAAARRAADTIARLRELLASAGLEDGGAVEGEDEGLQTSEQEIELLRGELSEVKIALAKAEAERKEAEAKAMKAMSAAFASAGDKAAKGGGGGSGNLPPPSAAAAAAAAAMQMPLAAMSMLPLFGMPPLNPYGGMQPSPPPATAPGGGPPAVLFRPPNGGGTMPKVASMPAMGFHAGGGRISGITPPKDRSEVKRKAEFPIAEALEEENHSQQQHRKQEHEQNGDHHDEHEQRQSKRQAVEGELGGPQAAAYAADVKAENMEQQPEPVEVPHPTMDHRHAEQQQPPVAEVAVQKAI